MGVGAPALRGEYKAVDGGRKRASLAWRANKIGVVYECCLQLGRGEDRGCFICLKTDPMWQED